MLSLGNYNLDYFIDKNAQNRYFEISNSDATIEEKIVSLLTLNPGFMVKNDTKEEEFIKKKFTTSINIIRNKVQKKEKLEFFTLTFNVKPHKKEITNGLIFPDISDFLTLLHLHLMFKQLNSIYSPGANLRIGIQISFFKKFNKIDDNTALEMIEILNRFNKYAMLLTSSSGYIKLFDVKKEIELFRKDFYINVEEEKKNILQEKNALSKVEEAARYFMDNVIDQTDFPDTEAAWNFCLYHAFNASAYKISFSKIPNTPTGLFERFDSLITAENRFESGSNIIPWSNSVYISFLPGALTFSYNKLHKRTINKKWEQVNYEEVNNKNHKGVMVKGFKYPLFFLELPQG